MNRTGRSPTRSRHLIVFDKLQSSIESGETPVGSVLPKEDELCTHFGISRYGLRIALGELERQGFIERKRRSGTKVVRRTANTGSRVAAVLHGDLWELVRETTVEHGDARLIQTDSRLARLLGCDELRRWHLLEGLRKDIAGTPIAVWRAYIDADSADIPSGTNFRTRPIFQWLEENYGLKIKTISQDISAVSLTESEALALGEQPGAPALKIIRRYFGPDRRNFEISVATCRSRDFNYNLQMEIR